MHALRTTIETIRSATTHRRLIGKLTIQTRVNYVRDLLDQLFEIAVVCVGHVGGRQVDSDARLF